MTYGTRAIDLPTRGFLDDFLGNVDIGAGMEGPVRVPKAQIAAQIALMNGLVSGVIAVVTRTLSTPPVSPPTGASYLVGAAPTGAWLGKAGNVARWTGTEYLFAPPTSGAAILVIDEFELYAYDGGVWAILTGSPLEFATLTDLQAVTTTTAGTQAFVTADVIAATVSRARSSNIATVVFASNHGLSNGAVVNIRGLGGAGYNIRATVASVPDSTTITYSSAGTNETTTADIGGQADRNGSYASNGSGGWVFRTANDLVYLATQVDYLRKFIAPSSPDASLPAASSVPVGQMFFVPDGDAGSPAFKVSNGLTYDTVVLNGSGGLVPVVSRYTAPAAGSVLEGSIRLFTDGDSGNPSLGVVSGGAWKRISLGATITLFDPFLQAYLVRCSSQPAPSIADVYNTFVVALRDANILSLLEVMQLYAGHSSADAGRNWVSSSYAATLPVAPTWAQFRGYTTNGSSTYINTNLTPSALSLSGQDDATMIAWVNAQKQRPILGASGGGNQSNLWTTSDSDVWVGLNHSTSGSDALSGLADTLHYLAISRTGAAAQKAYHRLGASSTFTRASSGRPTVPIFVGARNNVGSPTTYGAAEYAFFAYARGMDDSQHAAFKAALKTLMRGIGNYQEPLICWGDSRTAGGGGPTIWHTQITTASSDRRVAFNGGVSGERSLEIRNRMVANTVNTDGVHVIWAGYNGGGTAGSPIYRADAGYFAAVTGDIAAMVVDAQAKSGRYLVLTLPRSNMPTQYVGTTEGDALGAVNAAILSTYGTKAVDVATLLKTSGASTDPNGCIHADYVIDMVTDPIHLNTLGNTVVKDAVIAAIAANGWL